jgi:TatA/E family protein of Tat protein translocase
VLALLGPWDFVIIVGVLLLVFGTARFGAVLRGLGRGGRELKRELRDENEPRKLP